MTSRSRVIIFLVILVASEFIVTDCQNSQPALGTLEGIVTIGPIWPVERPDENRPVPPQVFDVRKVVVYNETKNKMLKTIDLIQIGQSAKANFSAPLASGQYVIDILPNGIDRSSDVPRKIEIKPGQSVMVEINIDTGIR